MRKMKIYIGNTGTLRHHEVMKRNGWGNLHLANAFRMPKKGISWVLDNGAYSNWLHKKPFDETAFRESLIRIEKCISYPEFIVCPDIVAGGYDSLRFSLKWLNEIPAGYPVYLAVQDGMQPDVISQYIELFDGVFIGGTLDWKLETAKDWIKLAHRYNKKAHIGKVGTFKRLVWAKNIGADSIDSSTFVQARKGKEFGRIYAALSQTALY
jgi:hypothetical protein